METTRDHLDHLGNPLKSKPTAAQQLAALELTQRALKAKVEAGTASPADLKHLSTLDPQMVPLREYLQFRARADQLNTKSRTGLLSVDDHNELARISVKLNREYKELSGLK